MFRFTDLPAEIKIRIADYASSPDDGKGRLRGPGLAPSWVAASREMYYLWLEQSSIAPNKPVNSFLAAHIPHPTHQIGRQIWCVKINRIKVRHTLVFPCFTSFLDLWSSLNQHIGLIQSIRLLSITYQHDSRHLPQILNHRQWLAQFNLAWQTFHTIRTSWSHLNHISPQGLEILHLHVPIWQSIKNMDAPGLFELSLVRGLKQVVFTGRDHTRVSNFISTPVQHCIRKAICRKANRSWSPTGLENPCPKVPWTIQALRQKRVGETDEQAMLRFLQGFYFRRDSHPLMN